MSRTAPIEAGEDISRPHGFEPAKLAKIGPALQAYVDDGELAGIVTLTSRAGEIVQLLPERNVHLEVVSLMAGDIEECFVSGEVEVAFDAIDANRFAGLTVEIAPESGDIALPDDERPGFRNLGVVDEYVDT